MEGISEWGRVSHRQGTESGVCTQVNRCLLITVSKFHAPPKFLQPDINSPGHLGMLRSTLSVSASTTIFMKARRGLPLTVLRMGRKEVVNRSRFLYCFRACSSVRPCQVQLHVRGLDSLHNGLISQRQWDTGSATGAPVSAACRPRLEVRGTSQLHTASRQLSLHSPLMYESRGPSFTQLQERPASRQLSLHSPLMRALGWRIPPRALPSSRASLARSARWSWPVPSPVTGKGLSF